MDKLTFNRWFRQAASQLGVPETNLKFMTRSQARGELGRYDPGENTIYVEEGQLQNTTNALHTALHELAHAIVYKRNSEFLERSDGRIKFDPNNPIASFNLKKLGYKGGHGLDWRKTASGMGVDVTRYVDRENDQSPYGQIRFGLGFKR